MPSACACLAVPYFSTLCHKRDDFRKNVTENEICVLIFPITLSEILSILRRIQRDTIINCIGSNVKYQLFLTDFNKI